MNALLHHTIEPIYDEHSEILLLGSFPSVKSRAATFYYAHPQNRFWQVIAALTHEPLPHSILEKKALLLRNHLALWDVIASCEITASSDSSIRHVTPNDLTPILTHTNLRAIFCNGSAAWQLYQKYLLPQTGIPAGKLPSTSPANAAWRLPQLIDAWQVLFTA